MSKYTEKDLLEVISIQRAKTGDVSIKCDESFVDDHPDDEYFIIDVGNHHKNKTKQLFLKFPKGRLCSDDDINNIIDGNKNIGKIISIKPGLYEDKYYAFNLTVLDYDKGLYYKLAKNLDGTMLPGWFRHCDINWDATPIEEEKTEDNNMKNENIGKTVYIKQGLYENEFSGKRLTIVDHRVVMDTDTYQLRDEENNTVIKGYFSTNDIDWNCLQEEYSKEKEKDIGDLIVSIKKGLYSDSYREPCRIVASKGDFHKLQIINGMELGWFNHHEIEWDYAVTSKKHYRISMKDAILRSLSTLAREGYRGRCSNLNLLYDKTMAHNTDIKTRENFYENLNSLIESNHIKVEIKDHNGVNNVIIYSVDDATIDEYTGFDKSKLEK